MTKLYTVTVQTTKKFALMLDDGQPLEPIIDALKASTANKPPGTQLKTIAKEVVILDVQLVTDVT